MGESFWHRKVARKAGDDNDGGGDGSDCNGGNCGCADGEEDLVEDEQGVLGSFEGGSGGAGEAKHCWGNHWRHLEGHLIQLAADKWV